jgi:23S rRNA U2552 (ribose-2'-O)-methylase RlmE/FtsJ
MESLIKKPQWKQVIFYKGNTFDQTKCVATYNEWNIELNDSQKELNRLREKIDEYEKDDSGKWEYYKKIINPFELIFTQKKYSNFPDSVCILHPLSRSYFKMIEMLSIIDFFDLFQKEDRYASAHVCEGPGGFIEAFIDRCQKNRKTVTSVHAMTLRPTQANVPGWKRTTSFLLRNKNIKIIYGADNTGNILKVENQRDFVNNCRSKVNLFTSDGGFDFSIDYLSQEKFIFPLLVASVRIGFEVLREGGVFIIKLFDIYSDGMQDLIYYLSCFFKTWTLYKPATSRPCNPEQYFIGKQFRGSSKAVIDQLENWCTHHERGFYINRLFNNHYPDDFKISMQIIVNKLVESQTYYLNKVFELIESSSENDQVKQLLKINEYMSYKWCQTFNAPVYSDRSRSIEALRNDPLIADQL